MEVITPVNEVQRRIIVQHTLTAADNEVTLHILWVMITAVRFNCLSSISLQSISAAVSSIHQLDTVREVIDNGHHNSQSVHEWHASDLVNSCVR